MAAHQSILAILFFLTLSLSSFCQAADILYSKDRIWAPAQLESRNGKHVLKMQADCNLVLYTSGASVWSTKTAGKGDRCYLAMRYDGDLAIYGTSARILIWNSNTTKGDGSYALVLRDDGNLVIYGNAIWQTTPTATATATEAVVSN